MDTAQGMITAHDHRTGRHASAVLSADDGRLAWVDVAKGLCIVLVVAMHSTLGVEKLGIDTGWMGALVEFARPFRMPDFFLLSGLFLSQALRRDLRSFLDRRVLHFLYFYGLWLTIQFAFKAPGMIAESGVAATLALYLLSLVAEPFGTLWFLWMLPVFALVVRLTRRVPVPAMLLVGAALEIAPIETGHVAIDEFAGRFVYFYAGYALAGSILAAAAWTGRHRGAAVLGLLVWAALEAAAVWSGRSTLPGLSLALGTVGALAIVVTAALLAGGTRIGAAFRAIGERSIVVYLAFFLPMAAMRTLLLTTGWIADGAVMSLVVTVFAVLAPFAIFWASRRLGLFFLFERPRWARLDRRSAKAQA